MSLPCRHPITFPAAYTSIYFGPVATTVRTYNTTKFGCTVTYYYNVRVFTFHHQTVQDGQCSSLRQRPLTLDFVRSTDAPIDHTRT